MTETGAGPTPAPQAAAPAAGGDLVPMIGPDGSRKMVPSSHVQRLTQMGARVASPQEVAAYKAQKAGGAASPYAALVSPGAASAPGVDQRSYGGMAPGRVPNEILSQDLATRRAEAIAKATTARAMGVQGLKGEQAAEKDRVPVDENTKHVYALAKLDAPEGDSVSKTEFATVSKLAEAAQKANLKPPSAYENMDGLIEGVHQFVASGGKEGTDPAQIPGFGQNSLKAQMLSALNKKYPDDFKGMAAAGRGTKALSAGQTAEARAPNSPQMFKIRAMANSLVPQLDMLAKASDAVDRGDVKLINSLSGKMGVAFSDKDWSALKKQAMLVADEFQAQIGAGSDSKLDLAKQLLDTADSPEVMKAAVSMLNRAVKARAIASTGAKPTEKQISGDEKDGKSEGADDAAALQSAIDKL